MLVRDNENVRVYLNGSLQPEMIPIDVIAKGPKDINIQPPWKGFGRVQLNLEANHIW